MRGEILEAEVNLGTLSLAPDISRLYRQSTGRYLLGHFFPVLTRPRLSPRAQSRISDLSVFVNWQIVLHALNCGRVWTLVVPFQKGRVVDSGENLRGAGAEKVP